jgi:hypothetical protein
MSGTRTTSEQNVQELKALWNSGTLINYEEPVLKFVAQLYELTQKQDTSKRGLGVTLAALFDLAVSAHYLEKIVSTGWFLCKNDAKEPAFVYPFVNACPRCTLLGAFHHLKAKKPESASIGQATSKILCAFLDRHVQSLRGTEVTLRVVGGNGIVDAIMLDKKHFTLFEIKSAPLVAFPLSAKGSNLSDLDAYSGDRVELGNHSAITSSNSIDCNFIVDERIRIPLGNSENFESGHHYDLIVKWLKSGKNLENYLASWAATFSGYANPDLRGSTYWLTNGCGAPTPRPADWPARSAGTGVESISDGKSSVGLDRTDDVKKGIYQVLKIATTYKEPRPTDGHSVSAVLASNIHAVKHHEDYLSQLENLVWTLDGKDFSYVTSRNDKEVVIQTDGLHNLFDGLVTFTSPHLRTKYLAGLFEF